MSCLCGPNRECSACLNEKEYIPLPERARLVEASRVERNRSPKRPSSITYPGYKGEPSILPGMAPKTKKPVIK